MSSRSARVGSKSPAVPQSRARSDVKGSPVEPTDVVGRPSSRRVASPVRVALAGVLGGDIDGAWWPRTAAMARELPDLVEALHPALGEVLGIDINWSAYSPTPVLSTMSPDMAAKIGRNTPHHRLMVLAGRSAVISLLVVPSMTAPPLAMMVLRRAAERRIDDSEKASKEFQAADRVMRSAQAESASWTSARAGARSGRPASGPQSD